MEQYAQALQNVFRNIVDVHRSIIPCLDNKVGRMELLGRQSYGSSRNRKKMTNEYDLAQMPGGFVEYQILREESVPCRVGGHMTRTK